MSEEDKFSKVILEYSSFRNSKQCSDLAYLTTEIRHLSKRARR